MRVNMRSALAFWQTETFRLAQKKSVTNPDGLGLASRSPLSHRRMSTTNRRFTGPAHPLAPAQAAVVMPIHDKGMAASLQGMRHLAVVMTHAATVKLIGARVTRLLAIVRHPIARVMADSGTGMPPSARVMRPAAAVMPPFQAASASWALLIRSNAHPEPRRST